MAPWLSKLLFIIVIFITNIVQAITSFAGTALAMPFSIQLVGVEVARPILNAIALVLCIYLAIRYHKDVDWKLFILITVFAGIGMAVGMVTRTYLYNSMFYKFYGIFVCLLATLFIIKPQTKQIPTWLLAVILIAGGFIHGVFVSGGPLIVFALNTKIKEKEKFRATLSFVWVLLNSVLLTQDLVLVNWSLDMLYLLLIAIPTVVLSIVIGKTVFKKLNNESFLRFAYILLFVSGFILLC